MRKYYDILVWNKLLYTRADNKKEAYNFGENGALFLIEKDP